MSVYSADEAGSSNSLNTNTSCDRQNSPGRIPILQKSGDQVIQFA